MNKKHTGPLQNGFLNISLASIIAGIMVFGTFIHTEYDQLTGQNQPTQTPVAPVTQTVTPTQTSTTDVLPPSSINPATPSNSAAPVTDEFVAAQTPVVVPATVTAPVFPSTEKSCAASASCLITAAKACTPSNGTLTETFNIFGTSETVTTQYEITGKNKDATCNYAAAVASGSELHCAVAPAQIAQTIADFSQGIISSKDINSLTPACTSSSAHPAVQ